MDTVIVINVIVLILVLGGTAVMNAAERRMWRQIAKQRRMRGVRCIGVNVHGRECWPLLERDLHPRLAEAFLAIEHYPLPSLIIVEYD